jgi:hypothetical protein
MGGANEGKKNMRMISLLRIASCAGLIALAVVPAASAKMMRRAPDTCVFHRKVVANGTVCSFDCDPKTSGCSQQMCDKGKFDAVIGCLPPFCTHSCGS